VAVLHTKCFEVAGRWCSKGRVEELRRLGGELLQRAQLEDLAGVFIRSGNDLATCGGGATGKGGDM
jgi:hypothetical protein